MRQAGPVIRDELFGWDPGVNSILCVSRSFDYMESGLARLPGIPSFAYRASPAKRAEKV